MPIKDMQNRVKLESVPNKPLTSIIFTHSVEKGHSDHGYIHRVREELHVSNNSIINMDSQAKYAILARGDANLYVRKPPSGYKDKIWVSVCTYIPSHF